MVVSLLTKIPGAGAALRGLGKAFSKKQKTTGTEVISSVKAKVNKTALDQAKSNLDIAKHKYKGSNKKLETTVEKINEQTKRLNKNK